SGDQHAERVEVAGLIVVERGDDGETSDHLQRVPVGGLVVNRGRHQLANQGVERGGRGFMVKLGGAHSPFFHLPASYSSWVITAIRMSVCVLNTGRATTRYLLPPTSRIRYSVPLSPVQGSAAGNVAFASSGFLQRAASTLGSHLSNAFVARALRLQNSSISSAPTTIMALHML